MKQKAQKYYLDKLKAFPDAKVRMHERVEPDFEKITKVHIVGVCGTAMGSLAGLCVEAGFEVSGSDTGCYPPMSDMIRELGITFHEGYDAQNIGNADVVIVGNAIGPHNPEVQHAIAENIPIISLAEALQAFCMRDKQSIVVAGTHGKTTTTGLLIHVFEEAGLEPSFMVGGVMQGKERSFCLSRRLEKRLGHRDAYPHSQESTTADYFIVEGDEYDTAYFDKAPKFLHYTPHYTIITSVEFDHADIYKNQQEYDQAFQFFASEVAEDGALALYGDDPRVKRLQEYTKAKTLTYGFDEDNTLRAENSDVSEKGQRFTLQYEGKHHPDFFVPMAGKHNLLNTLAVCAVALEAGIAIDTLRDALKTFNGMKRRQEVRGVARGVTVIDDFAHHPTAVRETVRAIRATYPKQKLIAIFEPRSNTSRSDLFQKEYSESFADADSVYLKVPVFLAHRDDKAHMLDVEAIVEVLRGKGMQAEAYDETDAIVEKVSHEAQKGDVILVMSNGGFDGIHEKLLDIS